MAAYLSLTRKSDNRPFSGSRLIELDGLLAEALGLTPDPVNWTLGWMNGPGQFLASGKTFAELRIQFAADIARDPDCGTLIDYLEAHFENTSYASH
jgi:hypothetical protein